MTALTSTKFTLKFDRETVLFVSYLAVDPDNRDYFRHFSMEKSVYDELGRPETITVTVEPGDRLNGLG